MPPSTRRPTGAVLARAATIDAPAGMPVLIVAGRLSPRLGGEAVAGALARGLAQGGLATPEALTLPARGTRATGVRELLEAERFDDRAHAARAVIVAVAELRERSLADSAAFEVATRARQAGVPAYAIAGHGGLDPFDARILDLQLVLVAASARSLAAAGRKLAPLLLAQS